MMWVIGTLRPLRVTCDVGDLKPDTTGCAFVMQAPTQMRHGRLGLAEGMGSESQG